ncbi:hypothetical protein J1605_007056 [Eschrichtius robustus]|uniref:Uncharacterized protein n=1 Tax=Eschrichtius robustus TaxID=9764 RepID=A0AB34H1D0_ESCRO|nr:hypothetical protein J1605_007056 [Eschrichtius robustus]
MRARNRHSCRTRRATGSCSPRSGAHPGTSRPTEPGPANKPDSRGGPWVGPPAPGLSGTAADQRGSAAALGPGVPPQWFWAPRGNGGRAGGGATRSRRGTASAVPALKSDTYRVAAALHLLLPLAQQQPAPAATGSSGRTGTGGKAGERRRWPRGPRAAPPCAAPPAALAPIGRSRHRPRPGRAPGSRRRGAAEGGDCGTPSRRWRGFCASEIQEETSLVAQWLRIRLPTQGTPVRALVREDPTCRGATKPVRHSY